jgi:hypothetical protein
MAGVRNAVRPVSIVGNHPLVAWVAVLVGIGSHLLRDLATGGAPLWHPRRVITWPVPAVLLTLAALTVAGWFVAGMPIREPAQRIRWRRI